MGVIWRLMLSNAHKDVQKWYQHVTLLPQSKHVRWWTSSDIPIDKPRKMDACSMESVKRYRRHWETKGCQILIWFQCVTRSYHYVTLSQNWRGVQLRKSLSIPIDKPREVDACSIGLVKKYRRQQGPVVSVCFFSNTIGKGYQYVILLTKPTVIKLRMSSSIPIYELREMDACSMVSVKRLMASIWKWSFILLSFSI